MRLLDRISSCRRLASATAEFGTSKDKVDPVDVEPAPRHGGADIDFVLMVAGDHLNRASVQLAAKILSRQLCRDHRAHALEIGKTPDMSFMTPILIGLS